MFFSFHSGQNHVFFVFLPRCNCFLLNGRPPVHVSVLVPPLPCGDPLPLLELALEIPGGQLLLGALATLAGLQALVGRAAGEQKYE